jgi:hypothetical protein
MKIRRLHQPDQLQDRPGTGHGTETFTGSISDVGVGTLTWMDQFSADVD